MTRVLAEGAVVGLANHTLLIAADGTERPIDDSGAPIRNRDGRIVGVVLVFRDVTERRRAEIERQAAAARARAPARERARRARGGRARQPREGRVRGDGVARAADAAERDPRLDPAAARTADPDDRDARARPRGHRAEHARPGAAHLRSARHQPHRVGQAAARDAERRPGARSSRTRSRPSRRPPTAKGIAIDGELDDGVGIAGRRPGAPAAGRLEPAVERDQVHADAAGASRSRCARSDAHAEIVVTDTGVGIRPEFLPLDLRALPPGRPLDHAPVRRARARARDREAPRRAARRHGPGGERGRRQGRDVHRVAAGRMRRRAPPEPQRDRGRATRQHGRPSRSTASGCWWSRTSRTRATWCERLLEAHGARSSPAASAARGAGGCSARRRPTS